MNAAPVLTLAPGSLAIGFISAARGHDVPVHLAITMNVV